jgi:hypothetical protein
VDRIFLKQIFEPFFTAITVVDAHGGRCGQRTRPVQVLYFA